MFEIFGEFDSAEEINKAAAAQLEQGGHAGCKGYSKRERTGSG